MAELNRLVSDNLALVVGILGLLLLVLLIVVIAQAVRLRRATRAYRSLVHGAEGSSLGQVLDGHIDRVDRIAARLDEVNDLQAYLERRTRGALQHIGMVRFNPFEDTGGDQSFAIAVLDDRRDGVVLSSLHGRSYTRVFAKPVENGESRHNLSDEEAQAIRIAVEGHGADPRQGLTPMTGPGPGAELDAMRLLARRRILLAARRLHRREPLRPDVRVDSLIAEVRADRSERRPTSHRGGGHLALDDAALRDLVDALLADGELVGEGRRVRLPDHEPSLDPAMRERVDRLLDGLRAARADPPRVDGPAARLGIPPTVIDQLRGSGELVAVAPGIDYPRDVYLGLRARLDALGRSGRLGVGRVRDELRTSRRHAEALIRHRAAERRRHGT